MGGTSAFSSQRSRFINKVAKKQLVKSTLKVLALPQPKSSWRRFCFRWAEKKRPGSRRRQRGLFGTTDTLGVDDTEEIIENGDVQEIRQRPGSRRGR